MDEKHHFRKGFPSIVKPQLDFRSFKRSLGESLKFSGGENAVMYNITKLRFDTFGLVDIFVTFELYIVKAALSSLKL